MKRRIEIPSLEAGQVLVKVAGCGVCHTDVAFWKGEVSPACSPPLTLGHEISGVVAAAPGNEHLLESEVIVPAVLPCGHCDLCRTGHGMACRRRSMLGNHTDGGFASHVVTSTRFLCPVNATNNGHPLWQLGVIADAVATPFNALQRANVSEGDTVIVIGVGGLGIYGVQIAAALGATVLAIDIDASRLQIVRRHGADDTLHSAAMSAKEIREAVAAKVEALGQPPHRWKVFEMSGTGKGQAVAFELLTYAGTIGIIGFTLEKNTVRLGRLMAFDAAMFGIWGCHPEYYPEALDMVLDGRVQIDPFIEQFELDDINDVFPKLVARELQARPVMIPAHN
ncbi:MAG: 6-hydroxycyclohex-1-ene-1-carbonyl-CoA dehydrogenase [Deltaproteobacteria bacterium]|nr:6-hydroxycyclohex-1-ene-1-carbonyl-CoA dehydrogenase [Deltaproteobacteria bacterium]